MTKQVINNGSADNDGTGDPLRTAFDKVNDNFTELYDRTVNVKDYGAVGDGVTDDTVAITAANTAASTIGAVLEFPAGNYLFTGSIEVERVTWRGPGVGRRNVNDFLNDTGGAKILLTNTTDSPFLMAESGGATFEGLGFFWPDQDGVAATPIVYPALFAGQTGLTFVDLTVRDCVIYNAYDVLATNAASKVGAVRFIDSKMYPIRSLMRLTVGAPEVIRVQGCDISVGIYGGPAIFAQDNLRDWTSANGCMIYVDVLGSAYESVDGLEIFDNLIYGYRYVIDGVSGRMDMPHVVGNHIDGCGTAVRLRTAAGLNGAKFDNIYYFISAAGTGEATNGFDMVTSGIVRGDFGGTCLYCSGTYFVAYGPAVDVISLSGVVSFWGQGSDLGGGASYGVFIYGANAVANIQCSFKGQYAASVGVFLGDGKAVSISGAFDAVYAPILIETTFTGRWVASGVVTSGTTGLYSIENRAAVTTGQALGCFFDIAPTGTTPKFGTFTSNADAAITGYITIIDEAGNTRKLATIA